MQLRVQQEMKTIALLALSSWVGYASAADGVQCAVPGKLKCVPTTTAPTLDGYLADWVDVQGIQTEIHSIYGTTYEEGETSYKCQYDEESIYFALESPGDDRFDTEDNKFCAAIGTMFKMGSKAAFINMGGCPDAIEGCAAVPDTCDDYRVDIGAHWELATTQQGVLYAMNDTTGSGNDLVANNDDEYAVSPTYRFDDDDADAASDWSGSWSHSNPVDGGEGVYKFELSRALSTTSVLTDKQLAANETYSFGIAFWDPFETEVGGWSKAGHFLTGCAAQWIDLTLDAEDDDEVIISCEAPAELVCMPVGDAPTLDGDLAEWADVDGIQTELHSIHGTTYEEGEASYKCLYDEESIYFALEIPGVYRFDTEDDKLCAAIGTMFKMGSKAAFINMGGCPDTIEGCAAVPDTCDDYRVDIRAHWELATTQQGVTYGMDDTTGSGNDLVANNDDEYAVSSTCRFDDDDADAASDWSGSWSHSNPVDGGEGVYRFELSRALTTTSVLTDKQFAADDTYSFGIALWDPFETAEGGWSEADHFFTGCASQWIDLTLKVTGEPIIKQQSSQRTSSRLPSNHPQLHGRRRSFPRR
jgi:hypothetical protein